MWDMFFRAKAFNKQTLENWNVSNVGGDCLLKREIESLARNKRARIFEGQGKWKEALTEYCAVQLDFMDLNWDKVRKLSTLKLRRYHQLVYSNSFASLLGFFAADPRRPPRPSRGPGKDGRYLREVRA